MKRPECICCSLSLKDPEEDVEEATASPADAKETTVDAADCVDCVRTGWIFTSKE